MEATEQRTAALARANEVRYKRAELRRKIINHRRNPIRVIQEPPEYAEQMQIEKLLTAIPGLGVNKVPRLLQRCEVSPSTTLGALTDRQRLVLARGIKEKAWLTR